MVYSIEATMRFITIFNCNGVAKNHHSFLSRWLLYFIRHGRWSHVRLHFHSLHFGKISSSSLPTYQPAMAWWNMPRISYQALFWPRTLYASPSRQTWCVQWNEPITASLKCCFKWFSIQLKFIKIRIYFLRKKNIAPQLTNPSRIANISVRCYFCLNAFRINGIN